jgi:hypothetical protein
MGLKCVEGTGMGLMNVVGSNSSIREILQWKERILDIFVRNGEGMFFILRKVIKNVG